MPLTREQKEKVVQELEDKINRQKAMTFVNFQGLGVKKFTELRKELKKMGAEVKVTKKTLANIAFENAGLELKDYEGQFALVFGYEDKVQSIKAVHNIEEETELEIVGGYFNDRFIDPAEVRKIAQLPGRDELLGKLTQSISSPLSGLVNTLQGNIKGLVYTLKAIQAEKSN
ncbi:MAG: 50S ribosomal protein L10 [Candidatus Paceibacterota bacterium]